MKNNEIVYFNFISGPSLSLLELVDDSIKAISTWICGYYFVGIFSLSWTLYIMRQITSKKRNKIKINYDGWDLSNADALR